MGLFGGPAGSSGSGTGSTANVYTPKQQGLADKTYTQIMNDILAEVGTTGAGSPAGWAYPKAQSYFNTYIDPYGTYGAPLATEAISGAETARGYGEGGAAGLYNAGQDILTSGFDPQSNLYNRTLGRVLDKSNVANAMAGLGSSPYGASVNANTLSNFDIDWQNALLDRQIAAGKAAGPLFSGATTLESTSSALPYTTQASIGTGAINALNNLTTLGNNKYLLPQQILNDLQSYLKLGQSASGLSGSLGQLGFNQTAQGIGGLLSGANTLFGSNGLFGSGSSSTGSSGYSTGSNWMSGGDYGGGGDYGTQGYYDALGGGSSTGSSGTGLLSSGLGLVSSGLGLSG